MKILKLLLPLLLAPQIACAQVATVVAIRGEVTTEQGQLSQGSQIYVGDTVTTAEKSFAVISFEDGSKVTVRPDSVLLVQKYDYDSAKLDLVSGGLRIITGTIAKENPDNYLLDTPVALMGVRGTEFSIQMINE